MCGVSGFINLNGKPVDKLDLKKMVHSLSHRGPDASGMWSEGKIGLGHSRLSIIDLSQSGNQPIVSQNGRYIISYNGEIYNFTELRRTLENFGFVFHTGTDTEVVLNSFINWGDDCFTKF